MKQSEFKVVDGVDVADLTGVWEGYSVEVTPDGYSAFAVNVSAERLPTVFRGLAEQVTAPGFFLLEVGSNKDVEAELRNSPTDPFHKDVFYLDAIEVARALAIVEENERNLIHDGGINFGFGSHEGMDEVFVGAYKIVYIYADAPEKCRVVLRELGFDERQPLKTVWENFTPDSPGSRSILDDATPTRWEMIEALKEQGLYFAERRED